MKKKILSTLLAVAMFASVAVPAFASNTSTQEGDPAKITMLEFRKDGKPLDLVEIAEDEEVDLDQYLMAWEDKDTLVLDKNQIVWEIRDTQSVFNMDSEGHIVATEPKGSATVIARDGEKEKVVAKLTVKAKPNSKETYANSWKFSSANYDVIYDNDVADKGGQSQDSEGLEFKAVAIPEGSVLTDSNKEIIQNAVRKAFAQLGLIGDKEAVVAAPTSLIVDLSGVSEFSIGTPAAKIKAVETTKAGISVSLSGKPNKAQAVIDEVGGENVAIQIEIGEVAVNFTFKAVADKPNQLEIKADAFVEDLTPENAVKLLKLPNGTKIVAFTKGAAAEAAAAAEYTEDELEALMGKIGVDTSGDSEIKFTVPREFLTQTKFANDGNIKEGAKFGLTVKTDFENKAGQTIKAVTAKTNMITKEAINTTKVSLLPNKTIEVGETFKLADTLGYGNAKANVDKGIARWFEAPLNNDASVDDYAIVGNIGEDNEGIVTGVKTGKNRIYVELDNGMQAYCTVTVVPKGTIDKVDDHNAVLKVKDVTVTVGGTQWIDMYNIDADSIVKWTSSDEAIAKIVGNSENKGAKVWGLKEGTATLTLTVDGDVAATLNVTVKGAATTPSKPDATGNAQTGDTLFSNLF